MQIDSSGNIIIGAVGDPYLAMLSSGGNGKKSVDKFNEEMAEKGISPGSQKYVDQMTIEMKAGTLDV